MIAKFKIHFKLSWEDEHSPFIKMLKTLLFNKIIKAGSILESLSKQNIDMNSKLTEQKIRMLEQELNEKKEEIIKLL